MGRERSALLGTVLGLSVLAHSVVASASSAAKATPRGPAGTAYVAAGHYLPLYGKASATAAAQVVPVEPFFLDIHAVTNQAYEAFLRAQPRWQRGAIPTVLADDDYLARWRAPLHFGEPADAARPVTQVSWFAARAYCKWRGMRLPTLAEWERAATDQNEASTDSRECLLRWYSHPARWPVPPVQSTAANGNGIWDLHGLIWEWVEDYNGMIMSQDATARFACGAAVGANDVRDYPAFMRAALRSSLKGRYTLVNLGFRCAADGPQEAL